MILLKRYRLVIAIVVPVLILIALKTFSNGSFKYDAKKWSAPSFNNSNIIGTTVLGVLPGDKLIVYLDDVHEKISANSIAEVHIPPDSILNRKYLRIIHHHSGPVLLQSSDPSLSARIWMVISQTGCRNIYILTSVNDNETFKNEFRPDTLSRPEHIY